MSKIKEYVITALFGAAIGAVCGIGVCLILAMCGVHPSPPPRVLSTVMIDETAFRRNIAATVRLRVAEGAGSGVVVAPHMILTASHVVRNSDTLAVDVYTDTGYLTLRGTVVACDDSADLALVSTADELPAPVVLGLGLCADLRAGAFCAAIGATAGHSPHNVTLGVFAGKSVEDVATRVINGQPYCRPGLWQVSCSGFPGNSGCGVYSGGELIGICISGDSPCTMFIVPVTEVVQFLTKEGVK